MHIFLLMQQQTNIDIPFMEPNTRRPICKYLNTNTILIIVFHKSRQFLILNDPPNKYLLYQHFLSVKVGNVFFVYGYHYFPLSLFMDEVFSLVHLFLYNKTANSASYLKYLNFVEQACELREKDCVQNISKISCLNVRKGQEL